MVQEEERFQDMSLTRLVTALIMAGLLAAALPAFADDSAEQRKLVEKYLSAYVRKEHSALRPQLTTKTEHLFGPYLLEGFPTLQQPKVDDNQALVEFKVVSKDKALPSRGGVLCYRDNGVWKVRQVLFYDQVPRIFNLPSRSVTAQDRAQEGKVGDLVRNFLKAWQRNDEQAQAALWYRWPHRPDKDMKGLSVNDLAVTVLPRSDSTAFARYRVKLTYRWGPLAYSMNIRGGFYLVEEGGAWKVNGNVMVFDF
jgi:type II secretory pathway pseudopilin PulG